MKTEGCISGIKRQELISQLRKQVRAPEVKNKSPKCKRSCEQNGWSIIWTKNEAQSPGLVLKPKRKESLKAASMMGSSSQKNKQVGKVPRNVTITGQVNKVLSP